MKRLLASTFCALLICGVLPAQSSQLSNLGNAITGKKNKNNQQDPNAANDLSNVDKDKVARIEAMPRRGGDAPRALDTAIASFWR